MTFIDVPGGTWTHRRGGGDMDREREGGVRGTPRGGGDAPGDPTVPRPFRSGIGDREMLREALTSPP